GDSTVCDQPKEPWNSWGQMLPCFFKLTVVIANHAESGETLKSSLGAKRLDKVLSAMKPGDYLFIQYGHNDMKDKATNALAVYRNNLKRFIAGARKKGGTSVLITSMEREAGVDHDTLLDYPATVRDVAKEENVALIDLHATSKILYKALGPNLGKAFQDTTHHNNYGSYELAKCVAQAVKDSNLPLAKEVIDGFAFDPSHPDPVETFSIPASPGQPGEKPLGD
ncbi:MAG TPA: rhamnogalacturonan acetylesterase, partial [Candidatus Paceibacterota bacterium]|nr:rhamnogalacturonan acetylesterase [Candidatus Paceibacterota bacterium]